MQKNNAKICVGGNILWKNKMLILYKPKNKWWECAGGKLENGETASKGAEREVFEETGLRLKANRLEGLYSFASKRSTMIYLKFSFRSCEKEEPKIKLSSEHIDYKWIEVDSVLKEHSKELAPVLLRHLKNRYVANIYDVEVNPKSF